MQPVCAAQRSNRGAPAPQSWRLAFGDVPQQIHAVARRSLYAHVIQLAHDARVTEKDGTWKLCS